MANRSLWKRFSKICNWKLVLAIFWLIFVISFAIWWMILGLDLIHQVQNLLSQMTDELYRQRRMMISEGLAWIFLLIGGGVWLITLLILEEKRSRRLKEFFASFSHEVKTAITSLRLQAETLKEDLQEAQHPALDRLVSDTVRLHLQLENSLFLSHDQEYNLYIENLSLTRMLRSLQHQWPQIRIEAEQDVIMRADERALKTVLSNIVHNAAVHGEAKNIHFSVKRKGAHFVQIVFQDDGKGFAGDYRSLGELFVRHNNKSGSGVGLYIAKDLVQRMRGGFEFTPSAGGFGGSFWLEGTPV